MGGKGFERERKREKRESFYRRKKKRFWKNTVGNRVG